MAFCLSISDRLLTAPPYLTGNSGSDRLEDFHVSQLCRFDERFRVSANV
jgi:hypothetical protein